ncbi:hypothetical protein HY732_03670 [Candidatus Uhrbacteria bacterium]|nr:hypothetical protein [Candidatus Uhrbacteria bacterium]
MRSIIILFLLLAASVIVAVASSVSGEIPFLFLFALLFLLPTRHVLLAALAVGFFLDMFSPVKGLSLFSYLLGIAACFALSRHLLTSRSLMAYLVLGMLGWLAVVLSKWLLFVLFSLWIDGGTMIQGAFPDMLIRAARGLIISCGILVLLYPLTSGRHALSYSGAFSRSRTL